MEEHFNKFIDRIGFYKTSIFQIDTHIKEFLKFRKDNLPKKLSKDFVMPILGSKLVYRNVINTKHEIKYLRSININNVEEKTQEIIDHYCNFCISQCFESFETFLKDILCQYFVENKIFVETNETLRKANLNLNEFELCRVEISNLLRNDNKYNKQVFKWLYKIDAKINYYEKNNLLRFDFSEWNVVLTEIRHAITHSNFLLQKGKTKNWTIFQKELLTKLFLKIENDNTISISTFENYEYITGIVAQHGQLIYDRIKTINNNGKVVNN